MMKGAPPHTWKLWARTEWRKEGELVSCMQAAGRLIFNDFTKPIYNLVNSCNHQYNTNINNSYRVHQTKFETNRSRYDQTYKQTNKQRLLLYIDIYTRLTGCMTGFFELIILVRWCLLLSTSSTSISSVLELSQS